MFGVIIFFEDGGITGFKFDHFTLNEGKVTFKHRGSSVRSFSKEGSDGRWKASDWV